MLWYLIQTLLLPIFVGFMFTASGACGCCDSSTGTWCNACTGGLIGTQYQIDIAGIVNKGVVDCANCSSLNGTYIVNVVNPNCGGTYSFPSDICDYYIISLLFSFDGGSNYVRHVFMSNRFPTSSDVTFHDSIVNVTLDCITSPQTLTTDNQHFNCDDSAATCSVTKL